MTERAGHSGAAVFASAAIVFVALLVVLAVRMRDGEDPALSSRRPPPRQPRRVLVRRVLEHRIVVHVPSTAAAPAASASQQVGAAGAFEGGSPLTRTS